MSAEVLRELVAGLAAERAALAGLVNVLEQEQDALAEGRFEELPPLAFDKDAAAGRVAAASKRRSELLERLGVKNERRAIETWIRAQADATLAQTWSAILRFAEAGRTLNNSNGLMVEERLRNTQQAISVLMGQSAGASTLYGRDGQARAMGGGRQLGVV